MTREKPYLIKQPLMENKRRLSELKSENFSADESLAIRQCSMLVEVNFRETSERHEVKNEMITVSRSFMVGVLCTG